MEIDKGSVVVVMCLIADRMGDDQMLSWFLMTQYVFQIVPLKEELHFLREPHENHQDTINKQESKPINTIERYVHNCTSTPVSFPSL